MQDLRPETGAWRLAVVPVLLSHNPHEKNGGEHRPDKAGEGNDRPHTSSLLIGHNFTVVSSGKTARAQAIDLPLKEPPHGARASAAQKANQTALAGTRRTADFGFQTNCRFRISNKSSSRATRHSLRADDPRLTIRGDGQSVGESSSHLKRQLVNL